ncbi:MAG: hypothetical protein ACOY0T_39385 [Myxococcota bacterium]
MKSFELGARAALRSQLRIEGALPLLVGSFLCAASAWLERNIDSSHGVDRALTRYSFGLWLPLTAYLIWQRASGSGRLESLIQGVARHAGNRRRALAGASLVLGGILALHGLCFASVTVLTAHPSGRSGFASDLLVSGWVGALAGLAYAAWLTVASGFGNRGRRGGLLILDLLFGSTIGVWALPFPRAHVRNLLGGVPPVGLAQAASSAFLIGLTLLALTIALLRAPD